MADSTGIGTQLQEIAVELSTRTADLLATAAKTLPEPQRAKVYEMIEGDLPTVIVNTLGRTTALHSPGGIDHLKENLDSYSEQFARMFLRND